MTGRVSQPRATEFVVLECPVPHRPPYRTDVYAVEEGFSVLKRTTDAVMDFIATNLDPPPCPVRQGKGLRGGEVHLDRQQSKPFDDTSWSRLLTIGVEDSPAQHLVPATNAHHGAPLLGTASHDVSDARASQPFQVGHSGPRPRQDEDVSGLTRIRVCRHLDVHPGLASHGVDVGGVGDAREPHHRNP